MKYLMGLRREKVGPCAWGRDYILRGGQFWETRVEGWQCSEETRWERRRRKWRHERGKPPRMKLKERAQTVNPVPVIKGGRSLTEQVRLPSSQGHESSLQEKLPEEQEQSTGSIVVESILLMWFLPFPPYFLKSPPCPLKQWFPARMLSRGALQGKRQNQQLSLTLRNLKGLVHLPRQNANFKILLAGNLLGSNTAS